MLPATTTPSPPSHTVTQKQKTNTTSTSPNPTPPHTLRAPAFNGGQAAPLTRTSIFPARHFFQPP
jgi:hypothetical protein